MRKLIYGFAALSFAACMEPQIAPDLSDQKRAEFTIETIAADINHGWSVAQAGPREYLVTERDGKLVQIKGGVKTEITGLPDDIYAEGQAGLFDVVLAPDFASTKTLYLSYAYGTADSNGTALMSAELQGAALINAKTLFRASPPKDTNAHFGGRIAFLADGSLAMTTGEGFKYREAAQDLESHLGKIIRIMPDGGTPSDNPSLGGKPQIYSYGHRNVQGLAIDAETGALWSHEHGPRGGDELNLIEAGANYGWPVASKGVDYNGAKITPHESFDGMVDGVHIWVPSIAPSGLAIYRGNMFPQWNGDALIGGLMSQDIRRVDLENGTSVGETKILSDLGARVRDVRVANDGAILVLTDSMSGQLLRVTPQ